MSPHPPRILIIGAGSRGYAYSRALHALRDSPTPAIIAGVADPVAFKRAELGQKFIWGPENRPPHAEEEFTSWQQFVKFERSRREREAAGETVEQPGVDAVLICVQDEMHRAVVEAVTPLEVHVLCEKPLATRLEDCLRIYRSLLGVGVREDGGERRMRKIFGIGHVLRYSPHNMLLRELVREREVVGDVVSVEHTEPVGWWHFSHSYVRGNWRKESTSAPSLLTKSCHDIDFLLWLLCSPAPGSKAPPHLPSSLTSTGSLKFFRKANKPRAAGQATNCLSCAYEKDCMYSAKKIYLDKHLHKGDTGWPCKIVEPEIEDCYKTHGQDAAIDRLLQKLAADYEPTTPKEEMESRSWYGRCVWESDNDVCDDQFVTITWDDDLQISPNGTSASNGTSESAMNDSKGRNAKTASFHMIAFTEAICERRGKVYGTKGEITYDSATITVHDFASGQTEVHHPPQPGGGHGGGDDSLIRQFVAAVNAVMKEEMSVEEAQNEFIGCTFDEVIRSHVLVFAAEEARREKRVVDWEEWWESMVEDRLKV